MVIQCRNPAVLLYCVAMCLMVTVPSAFADAPGRRATPLTPQAEFRELFVAVQMARIFPDSKTFADAVPLWPPARILEAYRRAPPQSPNDLSHFVREHFAVPPEVAVAPTATGSEEPTERDPLVVHIDGLWHALTRVTRSAPAHSSLLTLPAPYVVPGGRFREIYYWDSYFTLLGLLQGGRRDLAEDMVRDFAYLIDTYGHIPNGTRSYYLSRSQPPFFFAMVGLLAPDDPSAAFARYLPQLRREYAFWMRGAAGVGRGTARLRVVALSDGSRLNRYWDGQDSPRDEAFAEDTDLARDSGREPRRLYRDIRAAAESGWDFGSRWFADGRSRATIVTTEIVPVDLNSLLYGLERAVAAGCARRADAVCSRQFERRAFSRRSAIDRFLWNADAGAYLDYRFTRGTPVPRHSAATLYPLFLALSTPEQAAAVARITRDTLLKPGGIVATPIDTGQQWDSPNGWAPLQWIAVDGLRRYGYATLATAVACRWMAGVKNVYEESGKLVEKYDVVDTGRRGGGGEYPTQDGFGWTNGVTRLLIAMYPGEAGRRSAADCPLP